MRILFTVIIALAILSVSTFAQQDEPSKKPNLRSINDQVINDDLIVTGNLSIGWDAVNGENFGDNVIIVKENNVRIGFDDTSTEAGSPKNDWMIEANSNLSGGDNYYMIKDVTAGTSPLTLQKAAGNNALFVQGSTGNVGLGTNSPDHRLEVTGDAQVNSYVYFGDESTDGNWRVYVDAGFLTFQLRENGNWVTKFALD